jgi:hypothetical protein
MLPAVKKLLKRTSSPIACLGSVSLASATLSAVALIAVTAVPASASVPGGQGLQSFGFADCGSLGQVDIFGAPAPEASTFYLIAEEPGLHVVATRYEVALNGDVVFSKNFGEKAGLTTFTCTQPFENDEGTGVLTLTVAGIPPQ